MVAVKWKKKRNNKLHVGISCAVWPNWARNVNNAEILWIKITRMKETRIRYAHTQAHARTGQEQEKNVDKTADKFTHTSVLVLIYCSRAYLFDSILFSIVESWELLLSKLYYRPIVNIKLQIFQSIGVSSELYNVYYIYIPHSIRSWQLLPIIVNKLFLFGFRMPDLCDSLFYAIFLSVLFIGTKFKYFGLARKLTAISSSIYAIR